MSEQPPILIGITGRFGTGKSTVAAMLAEEIAGAQVVAFADALKAQVHRMIDQQTGWSPTPAQIENLKGECLGSLYQGWGELLRHHHGPTYWIGLLEKSLPPRAIVADVRYPNEAAWIKSRGGLLVAVSGPCRREDDRRDPNHPSERHVPEIAVISAFLIVNDYTLAALRTAVRGVAQAALKRAEGAAL